MAEPSDTTPRRGRGRPSVASDRRRQILDAFIDLVAEVGLDGATINAVAERSGIARTAVRHFVGNRDQLVGDALEVVVDRYTHRLQRIAGSDPSIEELIDALFSQEWIETADATDVAFDALLFDASRSDHSSALILTAYQTLATEIERAIRKANGGVDRTLAADLSYTLLCLAEQNATFQSLGFDAERSDHCHQTARQIAETTLGR